MFHAQQVTLPAKKMLQHVYRLKKRIFNVRTKVNTLFFLLFISNFCSGQNADVDLLHTLNAKQMPCWDQTMKGVSLSVYPAMPVSAAGIWLHGHYTKNPGLKRSGVKSAIGIGLAMSLSTTLKYTVKRTRPYDAYPNDIIAKDHSGTYSFPSGHTTAAFATATTLSLSYRKWYVTVPAYAYAGFVGYSRMRLGMHYPTDVLGGMVTGIGSSLLVWQVDKWMRKRKAKHLIIDYKPDPGD